MKINMTKKQIAFSALTATICHLLLLAVMLLMVVINSDGDLT